MSHRFTLNFILNDLARMKDMMRSKSVELDINILPEYP
jgi:hypothetical protein